MPSTGWRRLAAAGFASLTALAAAGAQAQPITMKIGHPIAPGTGLDVWAHHVKDGIEKQAPGRLDIRIYPAGQLGAIPRMIEGAQLGTIEMVLVPPAFLSGVDPRYSVVAAPGIFDDIAHAHRTVHDPAFKEVFWSLGESKGLKLTGVMCDAPSDYATVKPVKTLADFRGLKIRVFGSPLEIETLDRLGATGVPMPLSAVITAIQQHTIDGNKSGMPVFVPFHYEHVAKYVIAPRESIICITMFASKIWFDRLPADLQAIILEEAAAADRMILPWAIRTLDRLYKTWVANGGVLTRLSPEDQAELRRRLSSVGEEVLKDRPKALKVYKVMKSVAARRREG